VNDGFITDLNFADDIALLEDSWQRIAEITTRVEREAAAVGQCRQDQAHGSR